MKFNDQNLLVKVHGTVLERIGSIELGMNSDIIWHEDDELEGTATAKYIENVSEAMKEFEKRVKRDFQRYFEG